MFNYFYIFLLLTFLVSCNRPEPDTNSDNWIPTSNEDNLYGYLDSNENVMIDYQFADALEFTEGLARVKKNKRGRYFLIDSKGKIRSDGYDFINSFDSSGVAIVYKKVPKKVTPEDKKQMKLMDSLDFPAIHKSSVIKNKKVKYEYYLLNNEGQQLTDAYTSIKRYPYFFVAEKKAPKTITSSETQAYLLNEKGTKISDWYDYFLIKNNRVFASKNLKTVLLDNKGNKLSKPYSTIYESSSNPNFFHTKNNFLEGAIDSTGKELIPNMYASIVDYSNRSIYLVKTQEELNSYYEFMDRNFNIISEQYTIKPNLPDNSKLIGLADSKSKTYAYYFFDDSTFIKNSESFDLKIREERKRKHIIFGKYKIFKYYSIPEFKEGFATYKKDNKYGYLNLKGEITIPAQYKTASDFKNGKAEVTTKEETFYINTKGEKILN